MAQQFNYPIFSPGNGFACVHIHLSKLSSFMNVSRNYLSCCELKFSEEVAFIFEFLQTA
jgi:hypothetical protein